MVFGAQRPGYPDRVVSEVAVEEWINFVKVNGIKRVVCLLPDYQLSYYNSLPSGLLGKYCETFCEDNILHTPVEDYHLVDRDTLRRIIEFLKESDLLGKPVVVHCSGGLGRTGHILSAWLVHGRGFDRKDALKAVVDMGRDPYEAINYQNASKEDLLNLLNTLF